MTANNVGVQPLQYTGVGSTISGAQNDISGLSQYGSVAGGVLPQAQQTASNLYNNPYATQAMTGAQGAAGLGANAAYTGYGTGAGQIATGNSLVPYANQIMQTGMDPQQALYNQQFALNQNQSNVENAMAGVASTPYGAGVTNQSDQNFNINWQNQQLARQTQAAGAAGALDTQAGGLQTSGVNMMNQAPGQLVSSATIPYSTYTDIGTGQNTALSQLLGITGGAQGISNTQITDLLGLLGGQNQTNQVGNQTSQVGLNQSQLGWNQMASLGSGLGNLFGMAGGIPGLSSLFGGSGVGASALAGGSALGGGGAGALLAL